MHDMRRRGLPDAVEHLATTAATQALAAKPEHENAAMIRDYVLTLAREWDDGKRSLRSLRDLCTGQELCVAMGLSLSNDADRRLLLRLHDALLDIQNEITGERIYQTTFGLFTESQLAEAQAKVSYEPDPETGERSPRIDFPIRYPWLRKPDKERGDPGEPASPYYAKDADERRRIANTDRLPDEAARQLAEANHRRRTRFGSGERP